MIPTGMYDRPSLTEVAYREIRNSIVMGSLQPGDKLVVNDLVAHCRISNTPIKEALNRLVAEGLVETVPRRGMRVRLMSAKELRELVEIRTLYEVYCCRKAAEAIGENPHALEEMQATLAKSLDILGDANNFVLQFQLDEMFHMLMVSLCGNDMMIKDFDRIHANFLLIGIYANRRAPLRRLKETYEEHREILRQLEQGSPDGTEQAMRIHLHNTIEDLARQYHPTSGLFCANKKAT